MRRVTAFEHEADLVGRYVAGSTYLHACLAPTLWSIVLWGKPDLQESIALGRSLVQELVPRVPPHCSIIDASRIAGVDPAAFRAAGWYLEHHHEDLTAQLLGVALIRATGVEGAAIAGAFEVLRRPYPVRVFATAAEGYAWLTTEHEDPSWPADAARVLADAHGQASNTPRLIGELRVLVERNLVGLAIGEAAKRLGVSERTLQRKLGEHGTTYQDEVADARLRTAKQLLATTDTPITNIALNVGFASLQHFSALFHKRESMSPSDYRRRARSTTR